MYLVKTPRLLKMLYPDLMWDTRDNSRSIYVTFDDGPIPIVTPFVLNILKQFNAKATFFCIGDNVRKHPDIFEQVKANGHAIGNHTFNHLKGWKTDNESYLDNFLQADKLLNTNLFRPPYGRIKRAQAKLLREAKPDLEIVMWNILSADFDININPEKCLDNVLKNTGSGDIVLFHDSLKAAPRMEYALPKALEYWSNEGYEFKAISFLINKKRNRIRRKNQASPNLIKDKDEAGVDYFRVIDVLINSSMPMPGDTTIRRYVCLSAVFRGENR